MNILDILETISSNYGKYYEPIFYLLITGLLVWLTIISEKLNKQRFETMEERIKLKDEIIEQKNDLINSPASIVKSMKAIEESAKMMEENYEAQLKESEEEINTLREKHSSSEKDNEELRKKINELEKRREFIKPQLAQIKTVVSSIEGTSNVWESNIINNRAFNVVQSNKPPFDVIVVNPEDPKFKYGIEYKITKFDSD